MCPKSSPNLSECVKNTIEQMRPLLKSGKLGNGLQTEGFDPHHGGDIFIQKQGVTSNITQITTFGYSDFVIEKIKVDFNNPLFDVIIRIPKMRNRGISENTYSLGWLNSKQKGKFESVIVNMRLRVTLKGVQEKRNGKTYIKWTSIKVIPKVTQLVSRQDAFPDKALNEVINRLANENIGLILPDVEKSVTENQSKIVVNSLI